MFTNEKYFSPVYKLYELTYDVVKVGDPEFWMSEREYEKF